MASETAGTAGWETTGSKESVEAVTRGLHLAGPRPKGNGNALDEELDEVRAGPRQARAVSVFEHHWLPRLVTELDELAEAHADVA